MGENGGFDGKTVLPGGNFSRLLLSSDENEKGSKLQFYKPISATATLFSCNTPNLLCFGDFVSQLFPLPTSLVAHSDSSPSSISNNTITVFDNKRRNGSGHESGSGSGNGQKALKGKRKNKAEMGGTISGSTGHVKGREKLGERINALQQLVCPYGKTDAASVLHEAVGYIRFLQDQVKVLSSPYLQHLPCSSITTEKDGTIAKETKVLRSRGMCLVPVECIVDIPNNNGADFWSSNMTSSFAP